MHKTITPSLMRAAEQKAFQEGVPSLLLMENAARQITDELKRMVGPLRGTVLFAAGSGNNGGDAIAAARLYKEDGGDSVIWLPHGCKTEDAGKNLAFARFIGIPVCEELPDLPFIAAVDGLLGTGFRGDARGEAVTVIEKLNSLKLPILSIDIASGLDGETGAHGAVVHATVTAALHRVKPGSYLANPRSVSGRVVCLPIGLPDDGCDGYTVYDAADLKTLIPPRPTDAHKGSCGRVSLLCGSMGMAGAAAMAASAALRAGAGLVTVLCDNDITPILQTLVPNAMCMAADALPARDALLMGCGLPVDDEQCGRMMFQYHPDIPTVIDAGGLRILAEMPFDLSDKTVLTPHAGEAAAMLGIPVSAVTADPVGAARQILEQYGCGAVVLKNAVTVICTADQTALNTAGSSALAKGGSGDMLAGIITALVPQTKDIFTACCAACLITGLAGEEAERRYGALSPLTREVIDLIPDILR